MVGLDQLYRTGDADLILSILLFRYYPQLMSYMQALSDRARLVLRACPRPPSNHLHSTCPRGLLRPLLPLRHWQIWSTSWRILNHRAVRSLCKLTPSASTYLHEYAMTLEVRIQDMACLCVRRSSARCTFLD